MLAFVLGGCSEGFEVGQLPALNIFSDDAWLL
jgi:hypothetical protein